MSSKVEPQAAVHARAFPATTPQNWIEQQLDRCEISVCRIDLLLPAHSPRREGVIEEHIRLLAEAMSPLPPIIVHRPSMRVVDGMHRLRAAMIRGQSEIEVRWFDGDERDVFAIAVQTNVTHGLPLSRADRRNAAERIIVSHPHWSDRMIASTVNLASATVRAIRRQLPAEHAPTGARVGLDGRTRPANTAAGRLLAGELLRENPGSSIREIAKSTGLAPSTVLDVRNRLREGRDPVPQRQRQGRDELTRNRLEGRGSKSAAPSEAQSVDHESALQNLRKDPSLRFNDAGRMVLRWFETVPIDADKRTSVINLLPLHCLDMIAMLAGRQAAAWQEFADQLKKRSVCSEQIRSSGPFAQFD